MKHYDICIVGSGPSGMVAGVRAVRHNYSTLVIEQGPTVDPSPPRFEATPSDGVLKIMHSMKLPVESLSYRTMWVSPSGHRYLQSSSVPDLILKRGRMPGSLCEVLGDRFLDAGGEIRFNERVEEVEVSGGSARSVNGEVTFDKLIWAAGETVPSLEKFCLAPSVVKTVHGAGTTFESLGVPDRCTVYLNPRRSPGGYLYEVTSGGLTSVYNVAVDSDAHYHLEATKGFLEARGLATDAVRLGHAHIAPYGKKCIVGNVLLTGDAGFFNDYGLGYGARSAILTGYHAAGSIVKNYDYYANTKKRHREAFEGILVRRAMERFNVSDWDSIIGLMGLSPERNEVGAGWRHRHTAGWRIKGRQVKGLCRAAWKLL